MFITYTNDRKLSDYPFFNLQHPRPFPPGCITYLGLCVHGEADAHPFFASAISVSMDGVLVSLCKELSDTESEEVGSVYVAASDSSADIEIDNRKWSDQGVLLSGYHCDVGMMIDKSMLANSYGSYNGKFYLDPSCVTYMDDDVRGFVKGIVINGATYSVDEHVDFSCSGDLLKFSDTEITGGTAYTFLKADGANSNEFVTLSESGSAPIHAINNMVKRGTQEDPYPTLEIVVGSTSSEAILLHVLSPVPTSDEASFEITEPHDMLLEIVGTTAFPNCYTEGDEA